VTPFSPKRVKVAAASCLSEANQHETGPILRVNARPGFCERPDMALLALPCLLVIVRLFGAAALSRRTPLTAVERTWLGAVLCCAVVETLGFGFTGSSTIAAIFGASLGFGSSLLATPPLASNARRRVLTVA
jgi:hypothetical protein